MVCEAGPTAAPRRTVDDEGSRVVAEIELVHVPPEGTAVPRPARKDGTLVAAAIAEGKLSASAALRSPEQERHATKRPTASTGGVGLQVG